MSGCNRIGGGDCLSKTQDYAKFKNDVYDLTPVRCHEVIIW